MPPPPRHPRQPPSALERRGGKPSGGAAGTGSPTRTPSPPQRSAAGLGQQPRTSPVPRGARRRAQGGEMLTCSAVSPLLGPSSPSESVSLTTPRAASSPASLPSRREQCRREQLAAEPTPLREGGRQRHGLLPSSRPHLGTIQQCQQPAPTPAPLRGRCERHRCSGRRAAPARGKKKELGHSTGVCCSEIPPGPRCPHSPAELSSSCRSPGPAPCGEAGSRLKGRPYPWPQGSTAATSPLRPSSVPQPSPADPSPGSAEDSRANTATVGRESIAGVRTGWGLLGQGYGSPRHATLPCAPQGKRS